MVIKDGAKMSKSKGNVVSPDLMIERYGAEHHELAGRAKDMGSAAVFVPFTAAMVPVVDVKGGRIVLSAEGLAAMIDANAAKAGVG